MKDEVNGIPSNSLELLAPCVRQLETRTLLALDLIEHLATRPHLTRDRNAHGHEHTKLRYRHLHGVQRSLYLGNPDMNDELLLCSRITGRWPLSRSELSRTIRTLQAQRAGARQRALALAAGCGYRFRGWMLHKMIGETT